MNYLSCMCKQFPRPCANECFEAFSQFELCLIVATPNQWLYGASNGDGQHLFHSFFQGLDRILFQRFHKFELLLTHRYDLQKSDFNLIYSSIREFSSYIRFLLTFIWFVCKFVVVIVDLVELQADVTIELWFIDLIVTVPNAFVMRPIKLIGDKHDFCGHPNRKRSERSWSESITISCHDECISLASEQRP